MTMGPPKVVGSRWGGMCLNARSPNPEKEEVDIQRMKVLVCFPAEGGGALRNGNLNESVLRGAPNHWATLERPG